MLVVYKQVSYKSLTTFLMDQTWIDYLLQVIFIIVLKPLKWSFCEVF